MSNQNPLVNGQEYSWVNITVNILGRPVTGITKIAYGDKQEKVNNMGAGKLPVSRSRGSRVADGVSVEMFMSELEAIQAVSPNGQIDDIPPFDIVVAYATDGGAILTHTIHNAEFMENKRDASQGSADGIKVELPMIASHISWN